MSTAQPIGVDEGHPARWRTLTVCCLGVFLLVVSLTAINVALPDIASEFDTEIDGLQWIVDSYAITFAGLLLAGGALGDRIGRRRALIWGFVVFGAGNALGAAAQAVPLIMVARAAAGVGAALMMPATLSSITEVFSGADRGRAIAAWSGLAGAGGAFGPALGGWLLELSGWRAVFLLNTALAVLGVAGARFWVPRLPGQRLGRVDVRGAALTIAAVACLVYVAIEGPAEPLRPATLLAAAGFVALVHAYVAHERRTEFPLLPLALLSSRERVAGAGTLLIAAIGFNGVLFVAALMLQIGWQEGALTTGLLLVPIGVSEIVMSNNCVWLRDRFGVQNVISFGLCAMALGYVGMAVTPEGNRTAFVAAGIVAGIGNGLTIPLSVDRIVADVQPAFAGVAASVNEMSIELGASLGVGFLGALQRVVFERRLPPGSSTSIGDITDDAGRSAFLSASTAGFLFAAAAVMLALPLARRRT